MDNSIFPLLNELGLNEKQAQVYLACLELGSATIQELAAKSGVKRTSIYNFTDELKQKGLINEVQKKHKTILTAENPEVLKQRARERIKEAEEYGKKIEGIIPDLESLFNPNAERTKIKYYQGINGIKQIYEDTLTASGPIFAFSDYEKLLPAMDFDYMINYADRRAAKDIHFYSICPPGPWAKRVIALNKKQKRETKVVERIQFDTEINIYGNKVALLSFRRPYAGIIIEDRAIAQTLKTVWTIVWNQLK